MSEENAFEAAIGAEMERHRQAGAAERQEQIVAYLRANGESAYEENGGTWGYLERADEIADELERVFGPVASPAGEREN